MNRIVNTSQLVNKDLLQRQGNSLQQNGLKGRNLRQNVILIAADNVGVDAADLFMMQHIQRGGHGRLIAAEGHL